MADEKRKTKRPVPRVDEESRPFWEACARHELYIQKCKNCGTVFYYPRGFCPEDLSADFEWVKCSGRGKVYTYTVTRQNQSSGFRDKVPYVMAYVELEEGIRMLTNIVDCDPDDVYVEMPVSAVFEKANESYTLVKFRPI